MTFNKKYGIFTQITFLVIQTKNMGNYNRNSERSGGSFGRGFGSKRSGGSSDRGFGGRGNDRPTMHDAICSDCGSDCQVPFRPTGDKPVLCSNCFRGSDSNDRRPSKFGGRNERRDRSARPRHEERQMHDAVCDTCHKDCQVPFRPTGDKPIFCDNCFGKGENTSRSPRSTGSGNDNSEQLKMLNTKLDKLIAMLSPKGFVDKTEKPKNEEKKEKEKVEETEKPKKLKKEKTTKKTTKKK